jgi:hypothetical protein
VTAAPLIPCAHCPAPAVVFNHRKRESLCAAHDDGLNEPLAQADGLPWTEYEMARWRAMAGRGGNQCHPYVQGVRRWLATLDAKESK